MHGSLLSASRTAACVSYRSGLLCSRRIARDVRDVSSLTRQLQMARLDGDLKGVVTLEMNHPKANALGSSMVSQLEEAIREVSRDETVRAVVFSSNVPGVFCAGADLKERASMSDDEAELFVTRLRTLMSQVASLPAPTIAVAEGAAYGGGLELMLACDVRIAGGNAMLGLTETSLGIIPGAGGTQRLPRLIGASKAKQLIFTAQRVDAERALDLGMIDVAVAAGHAYAEALSMAGEISQRGPLAIRAAKQAIDDGLAEVNMEVGMGIERRLYGRILGTSDRREGLKAFKERRTPRFEGK